jgi:hypothetical protein
MFVLTRNFVVGDQIHQLADKVHHLLMPGHIGHGEAAGRAFSTVGDALWGHGRVR